MHKHRPRERRKRPRRKPRIGSNGRNQASPVYFIALCITAANADKLFLVIGQSNAAGHGKLPNPLTELDDVYVFNGSNKFVPATEQMNNRYSTIGNSKVEGYSLAYTFGETMQSKLKEDIKIVSNAKGSAPIRTWEPGQKHYEAMSKVMKDALKVHGGGLDGVLCMQDARCDQCIGEYAGHLNSMINAIRKEFGNIPVVTGELAYDTPEFARITDVLNAQEKKISKFSVASAKGLSTKDKVHFDVESLQTFGVRFANEMLPMLGKSSPAPQDDDDDVEEEMDDDDDVEEEMDDDEEVEEEDDDDVEPIAEEDDDAGDDDEEEEMMDDDEEEMMDDDEEEMMDDDEKSGSRRGLRRLR